MPAIPPSTEPTFREKLRVSILANAERIIAEEGLSALQARRVATQSNCSIGTVYNVFGDLDGLVICVNDLTLEQLAHPLQRAFDGAIGQTQTARLISLALAYKDYALTHQLRWRAVFEHRPQTTSVSEQYRTTQTKLLNLIEDVIKQNAPDPKQRAHTARALFAGVHGIIALAIDDKMSEFDATVVEKEIRILVGAASAGLATANTSAK